MHQRVYYGNLCGNSFARRKFASRNIGYSKMRKWAHLIFDTTSLIGWALLIAILIDATILNSKLITGIMVR